MASFEDFTEDHRPHDGQVFLILSAGDEVVPVSTTEPGQQPTPIPSQFDENSTPQHSDVLETRPPAPPPTPEERRASTQQILAYMILGSVAVMYLAGLVGVLLHSITVDEFAKIAVILGGPLGLAGAVTAFLYGEGKSTTK